MKPNAQPTTWTEAERVARKTDSAPPAPALICAWCPGFVPAPGGASHGICPNCAARMEREITEHVPTCVPGEPGR